VDIVTHGQNARIIYEEILDQDCTQMQTGEYREDGTEDVAKRDLGSRRGCKVTG